MPQRNLILLAIAILGGMICYQFAPRNRYAASVTYAMNLIQNQYVDEVEPKVLFTGAMEGMARQLDPNSDYSGPVESQRIQDHIEQKFGGIGVLVELNAVTKRITVMSPLVGTPAYNAGLLPGDTIIAIDGQDTADLSLNDCVKLIQGPEGKSLTLTISRETEPNPLDFVMKRAIIKIDSVMGDLRQKDGSWRFRLPQQPKIAYFRVTQFGEETVDEVKRHLQEQLTAGSLKGVILDLRDNSGGLLTAALGVSDAFLNGGLEIVSTRGRNGERSQSYLSQDGTIVPDDVPVVVMINGFSASASEIVAACLQDHHRATIVGERSYGKGTVQNLIPLPGNRGTLRLTVASFWRPSGVNIHKWRDAADENDAWGVIPDPGCEVKLSAAEQLTLLRARRQRDAILVEPGQDLAPEPTVEDAPEEDVKSEDVTPDETTESEASTEPPMLKNLGRKSPLEVDPQLQKAVEMLEEKIVAAEG